MKKVSLAALIAAAGFLAASAVPAAAREHWEHGRVFVRPAPVVVSPYYYGPAPVYVAPAPVYVAPPPVVVAPVPSSLNVVVPLRFH